MSNPIIDKRNMALVKDLRIKSNLSPLDRYRLSQSSKELPRVDQKELDRQIQKARWKYLFEQGKNKSKEG